MAELFQKPKSSFPIFQFSSSSEQMPVNFILMFCCFLILRFYTIFQHAFLMFVSDSPGVCVDFFFNRIHGKDYQRNCSFSPIKKSEDGRNEAFMAEGFRRCFPIKPADRPFEIISP